MPSCASLNSSGISSQALNSFFEKGNAALRGGEWSSETAYLSSGISITGVPRLRELQKGQPSMPSSVVGIQRWSHWLGSRRSKPSSSPGPQSGAGMVSVYGVVGTGSSWIRITYILRTSSICDKIVFVECCQPASRFFRSCVGGGNPVRSYWEMLVLCPL